MKALIITLGLVLSMVAAVNPASALRCTRVCDPSGQCWIDCTQ